MNENVADVELRYPYLEYPSDPMRLFSISSSHYDQTVRHGMGFFFPSCNALCLSRRSARAEAFLCADGSNFIHRVPESDQATSLPRLSVQSRFFPPSHDPTRPTAELEDVQTGNLPKRWQSNVVGMRYVSSTLVKTS